MASYNRSKTPYVVRPPPRCSPGGSIRGCRSGRPGRRCSGRPPTCSPAPRRPSAPSPSPWAARAPRRARASISIYSRLSHPNAEILEDQVVPLEPGAHGAAVFNSGMAAISTLFLTFCPPGSSFIYTAPIYGGTQHLIHQLLEPLGLKRWRCWPGTPAGMTRAIAETPGLRLVFIETPSNPTLRMTDIAAAGAAARGPPGQAAGGRGQHLPRAGLPAPAAAQGATWWCTPRPSTWPATATCWAAWCWALTSS